MKIFARITLGLLAAIVAVAAAGIAWTWEPDRPAGTLTARWAPPPSQFLEMQGMRVHYRDEGPRVDAVPLVLIHGTSASLHTWEGWASALKDRRRVIRFDLPAFGLTGPSPAADYRIETYTQFVVQVLDKLGVRRCVVAGNSLGGNIAWQLAVSAPDRVERLILVDAGGYIPNPASMPLGFRIARTPVLNDLLRHTLPHALIEASVRNVYGDPSRVTSELTDRYLELTLREGNRLALARRFQQTDMGAFAGRIKSVKVPTLILWGRRDRLIPLENAYHFQQDISGSQLVVFDDLGHVPHEEDPARTVRAVMAFLNP